MCIDSILTIMVLGCSLYYGEMVTMCGCWHVWCLEVVVVSNLCGWLLR